MATLYRSDRNVQLIVKCVIALALLPADKIPTGFAEIITYVHLTGLMEILGDFLRYNYNIIALKNLFDLNIINNFFSRYYEQEWLGTVGPACFSVYNMVHRTNNDQEGFHKRLNDKMRPHPNVWHFLGMILTCFFQFREVINLNDLIF